MMTIQPAPSVHSATSELELLHSLFHLLKVPVTACSPRKEGNKGRNKGKGRMVPLTVMQMTEPKVTQKSIGNLVVGLTSPLLPLH